MKLDKRACRHASNVPLHISLNAGVLYTDRVKYPVTAAVKLLGGHRVLAVYFYECERLKANDRMPKWVVFQGKDDFATLERDAEGNVKWRDSMLENLVDESFYKFRESCVFYKGTDGVTISDFIHQSASGITILEALQVYQYGIRNKQAKKRRCKRDMGIVEKMKRSQLRRQIWHVGLTEMSCRTICFIRMTETSRKRRSFVPIARSFL